MIDQMKAENFRLWKRKGNFFVALALFALNFIFAYQKWALIKDMDEILALVVGDASFQIVISLCVAWFVGSEFNERTIQNELKLGYSRSSVLFVRFLYSGLLAVFLHISFILGAYAGVAFKYGIELSGIKLDSLIWLLVVLLQVVTSQSFTLFIVFLLKRALAAMVAATLLSLVACNILRNFMGSKIFTLSCFCLAQNKGQTTLLASALYAIATLIIVMAVTYLVFRKADMG